MIVATENVCPCGSGDAYASCCGPLHRGTREAQDAEALMRSRYAAFVRHEHEYLWRTLHSQHDERARGRNAYLGTLDRAAKVTRFHGLTVQDRDLPKDLAAVARVLFSVRVMSRGQDVSFTEMSSFLYEGGGWRYLCGFMIPYDTDKTLAAIDAALQS